MAKVEYRIEQPQLYVVRAPPWALLIYEWFEIESPKLPIETLRFQSFYEVVERVVLEKEPSEQRYKKPGKRVEDWNHYRQGLRRQLLPPVRKQGS